MAVPTSELWGIRAHKVRLENRNAVNQTWVSKDQGRPIQLNRVDYNRTTGSIIGVQMGPNATVLTTHQVTGAEIRARSNVGTGGLLAVNADVNAASSTGTISGRVKALEANVTVKGTRTVDNEITAMHVFMDLDSTVTKTLGAHVFVVSAENIAKWDSFLKAPTTSGIFATAAGAQDTAKWLKITHGTTTFKIALYADS